MLREEDYLMISGIQHFCFCRRQWALIHIEQEWSENLRTTEGRIMHRNCHDETRTEKRGDCLIIRGMRVISHRLEMTGICDVVEFRQSPEGVPLSHYPGNWDAAPVEYKRGHQKSIDADRLQLCAQVIALEEMLVTDIPRGFLYYGETKKRECVKMTSDLRAETEKTAEAMKAYFLRGITPKAKVKKGCGMCSLKELCLPELSKRRSVSNYIEENLAEQ